MDSQQIKNLKIIAEVLRYCGFSARADLTNNCVNVKNASNDMISKLNRINNTDRIVAA